MTLLVYIFWLVIGVGITIIALMLMDQAWGQTVTPTFTPPQVQYAPIEVKASGQNDYLAMIMPLIILTTKLRK